MAKILKCDQCGKVLDSRKDWLAWYTDKEGRIVHKIELVCFECHKYVDKPGQFDNYIWQFKGPKGRLRREELLTDYNFAYDLQLKLVNIMTSLT